MAEFQSPRFAGDPVLEQILNDPDTGTVKLQPGSPADSVTKLQQALFDLGYNEFIDPPEFTDSIPESFIDGVYGPRTTGCVLAYKKNYNIYFPPDAPTGSFDGFAGPRTFQRLDPQCVLFDEAVVAISEKAAGLGIEISEFPRKTSPQYGTSGTASTATDTSNQSTIYYKRGVGAAEVHGAIQEGYVRGVGAPGPRGALGFPISEEQDDSPGFRIQAFENGAIRIEVATGATEILNLTNPDLEDPIF
jgi:peptidoglycan hydrolase-like protein with peptidoglycan-binding domain